MNVDIDNRPIEESTQDEDQNEDQISSVVDIDEVNEQVINAFGQKNVYELLINQSRFDWWLKAFMIRYWVDFGKQKDYRVNWVRKTDQHDENSIVEIIIQIFRVQVDGSDSALLFSLIIFVPDMKVKIQGKYSEFWKNTEFSRLRDFVNKLQLHTDYLDTDRISADYGNIFKDETTENMTLPHLDLSEVSWEATLISGSGIVTEDTIIHRQQTPCNKRSRKIRRRSMKVGILTTPVKRHCASKKIISTPTAVVQQKLSVSVQLCLKRISELEEIIANVDKLAVASDFKLCSLSEACLDDSLVNRLNQEMKVLRITYDNKLLESEERMCKAEHATKKLQGRLGSLNEFFTRKIKSLQEENDVLKDCIFILQHNDNTEDLLPNTSVEILNVEDQVINIEDKQELVEPLNSENEENCEIVEEEESINARHKVPNQDREIPKIDSSGTDTIGNGQPLEQFDFVFLCDSNRKFIDNSLLCPKNTVKVIPCNTTDKAIEIILSPRFVINKGLIINTGVNDLEHLSTQDVIEKQIEMINLAIKGFPDKKIILSSITPRDDSLDQEVDIVNAAVYQQVTKIPNVIYVNNNNLRKRTFYFDHKHLNKKTGIREFATNLKRGVRLACGIPLKERRSPTRPSHTHHPHPTDVRPPYPSDARPTYSPGVRPTYSPGVRPPYPSDVRYPYPSDVRPTYPSGVRPPYTSNVRSPYPPDVRPPYTPDVRPYPSDVRPPYPSDVRPPYPSDVRPPYPSDVRPISLNQLHQDLLQPIRKNTVIPHYKEKQEEGNNISAQLSSLTNLVNILVSNSLTRSKVLYPQSATSTAFQPSAI